VALDSDLDAVVSGCQGGCICVHTIRRGEFIRSFYPPSLTEGRHSGGVEKVALHSTGKLVAHMSDYGLHTYTINGVRLCTTDAGEKVIDMKICSSGEILITGGGRCQVLIRTTCDLAICAVLDLARHGPIRCLGLTPNDLNPARQYLFVGSDDGMITIVDEDTEHRTSSEAVHSPAGLSFLAA
jgi:WD40 repeat protein